MNTVSELLNEFLDRINQPREASYVGATTPGARQYLSLLKFVGSEIFKQGDWSVLKRLYYFDNVEGTSLYQLPGDFWKPLSQTQYSVTNQIIMGGPLTDSNLALRSFGITPEGTFPSFQINGAQNYVYNTSPYTQYSAGYFQITPAAPDSDGQNVIGYLSKNYFWPAAWQASQGYLLGNIVTGLANMYYARNNGNTGTTRPSVTSGTEICGAVLWQVYTEPYQITTDDDICLFDDDLVIEGLRWAWYQAKKQDYLDLKQQWERSCRTSLGAKNAGAVINAGYNVDGPGEWPNVPTQTWSGTGGS